MGGMCQRRCPGCRKRRRFARDAGWTYDGKQMICKYCSAKTEPPMPETNETTGPTEAEIRAALAKARTSEMSRVEAVICEDAFEIVSYLVKAGEFSWQEVVDDPHYVVAQVFDDYFDRNGLDDNGLDDEEET